MSVFNASGKIFSLKWLNKKHNTIYILHKLLNKLINPYEQNNIYYLTDFYISTADVSWFIYLHMDLGCLSSIYLIHCIICVVGRCYSCTRMSIENKSHGKLNTQFSTWTNVLYLVLTRSGIQWASQRCVRIEKPRQACNKYCCG